MNNNKIPEKQKQELEILELYKKNPFLFFEDMFNLTTCKGVHSLWDKDIFIKKFNKNIKLFDKEGNVCYFDDLKIYKKDFFQEHKDNSYTWHQTLTMSAYKNALSTFDTTDFFDSAKRYISIVSGHGTGKTTSLAHISLHFLIVFPGCQIGMTSNTESQIKDVFMKECYKWIRKMKPFIRNQLDVTETMIKIKDPNSREVQKDWFLRGRVASKEKPEALAGIHADYVLMVVDEASGVDDKIFEIMRGALTGNNFVVVYTSNGTRSSGEFYESHRQKNKKLYTQLQYNSLESPVVNWKFVDDMRRAYGEDSEEFKVRVLGKFPNETAMDDKGWIPLFGGINIMFEEDYGQKLITPVLGLDPAGEGKDRTIINGRDNIFLKTLLKEEISNPKSIARKVHEFTEEYNIKLNSVVIDGFGIGARTINEISTTLNGEKPFVILGDNKAPNEEILKRYNYEIGQRFANYKSYLAWQFREWIRDGGIIVTNQKNEWLKELEKIRYARTSQGKIELMNKVTFRKEFSFSPDLFDAAIYTFAVEREIYNKYYLESDKIEDIEKQRVKDEANFMRTAFKEQNNSYNDLNAPVNKRGVRF